MLVAALKLEVGLLRTRTRASVHVRLVGRRGECGTAVGTRNVAPACARGWREALYC